MHSAGKRSLQATVLIHFNGRLWGSGCCTVPWGQEHAREPCRTALFKSSHNYLGKASSCNGTARAGRWGSYVNINVTFSRHGQQVKSTRASLWQRSPSMYSRTCNEGKKKIYPHLSLVSIPFCPFSHMCMCFFKKKTRWRMKEKMKKWKKRETVGGQRDRLHWGYLCGQTNGHGGTGRVKCDFSTINATAVMCVRRVCGNTFGRTFTALHGAEPVKN